ncbi:MAG TPA: (p)ppGpp synthetase [Cyanobacteria bacterium UBA11149]|nr:(p)ppGpp synthetase [Cyanobacteria bacterium UBA11367]HBE60468.1 (p)ppGpp synthetase [Cyanobacteria bacterium UBA11366]HBK62413.1 (p)ppGpp synthetase [Cyanobacteria bacterium UBA11166]HBR75110.1 (p)ppGpp synthetase [Cyanobacteria bacterium UBA11159]HBS70538.1 (p)ppGpp synthetase [Cyanobacteria bacterium UBA11153]HBW90453.1 (p)ppGpp synthetase [Cyanobacteria bacterium UBA11149]HCA96463.1 (p)ppGpp synthetase [Cyanobacteria bacterium UBA9226]
MDAIATTATFDVEIPDWLQECLSTTSPNSHKPVSDEVASIAKAFEFGYDLHRGQYRASGEPYIAHPIAVAGLLRDLGGNSTMIAAGFLHDVVEDTDVTLDEMESRFGVEVRHLVEGVTKLSKFNFSSKTEREAENFRRMFLAMAKDIRVIVVKLADRLHNMRTLQHLKPEKQRSIAQETREIFAPLANRLGIGRFKWELEDLAFKYLEPEAYREIQQLVAERRQDREERLAQVSRVLRDRLNDAGIECIDLSSRPKHLYSIYQKMQRQQKSFHEIYDLAAMRIIVKTNEECYRTLAVVHDAFRPIPGRFKDYIGLPKANRYQSLHTGVMGPHGRPIEVQIRTLEMHHVAEYGIAAHWKYKESGNSTTKLTTDDEKFTWLRQLLEWQSDLKDAQEYIDSVKDNLFDDDVYVFTPLGDVVALSRGATPVDFAYRIHTEVGHHCTGVRINAQWRVLDTPLKNGDIVEIITQKNARPSLDWLNFAVTPSARNRIRQWYKRFNREENIARGRDLLEKELGKSGFESLLKSEPMQSVVRRCNYHSVEDLLAALGYGEITVNLVVKRWRDMVKASQPVDTEQTIEETISSLAPTSKLPLCANVSKNEPIIGVEGLMHKIAGCCNPVPGEPIIGVVTKLHGISIHRQGCANVENVQGDRIVPVSWNQTDTDNGRPQTYPVNVQIEAIDRVGVFKDVLSRLCDQNINVRKAQVKTQHGKPAIIDLCIDIRDYEQLQQIFTRIKKMSDILALRRVSEMGEC